MSMQEQLFAAMEAAREAARETVDNNITPNPNVTADDDGRSIPNTNITAAVNTRNDDDDDTNWQAVGDLTQELAAKRVREAKQTVEVKNLHQKALLVSVKRRMYNPYRKDDAETARYGAGNVNKHLFKGRDNRVAAAIAAYNGVYTHVKENTVPWSTGVDLLKAENYLDFSAELRRAINNADQAVNDLVTNWDHEVNKDYQRLLPTGRADYDDYPSASQINERFGIDVQYSPVPKADGFDPRLGIKDEDVASLQRQLDDVGANATKHVISSLLTPMKSAAEKLAVPIGADGAIFRDSLIDNMVEVAERMGRVNISEDPVVAERIKDLRSLIGTYANNKDMLRTVASVREKAATQIDALCGQMAGLV